MGVWYNFVMKKYKYLLLTLISFILAPLWVWLSIIGKNPFFNFLSAPIVAKSQFMYGILPYFIFIILGIFFGWKNSTSKSPLAIGVGNSITLLGIFALFFSILLYIWAAAWSG